MLAITGNIEHFEQLDQSPAPVYAKDAGALLREAVRAIESVRTRRGRPAPEAALDRWKGLVDTRWSMVEHVEVDGRRYFLAEETAPANAPRASLTTRERQILTYAVLGHTNKQIAYDLGIAASTVRVLVARAAEKLGTSKRDDTLRAFESMSRTMTA